MQRGLKLGPRAHCVPVSAQWAAALLDAQTRTGEPASRPPAGRAPRPPALAPPRVHARADGSARETHRLPPGGGCERFVPHPTRLHM
jgi:hypothetical protein